MTRIASAAALGAFLAYLLVVNVALSRPLGESINASDANADPVELATTTDASYNWAGYVADEGSQYTAVSATWTVPEAQYPTGSSADVAADATWVGIGGVETRDLIQAGTQALVDRSGNTQYQAWYEVLPQVSQPVDLDIEPGDSVSVAVTYAGGRMWHISFVDNTTNKQAAVDVPYDSSYSSAEWVQEMPSLAIGSRGHASMPLDAFGRVTFSNASTVADGEVQSLDASGAQPLKMQNGIGQTLAAPSVLSGADTFSVVRSDAASVAPRRVHVIIIGGRE